MAFLPVIILIGFVLVFVLARRSQASARLSRNRRRPYERPHEPFGSTSQWGGSLPHSSLIHPPNLHAQYPTGHSVADLYDVNHTGSSSAASDTPAPNDYAAPLDCSQDEIHFDYNTDAGTSTDFGGGGFSGGGDYGGSSDSGSMGGGSSE